MRLSLRSQMRSSCPTRGVAAATRWGQPDKTPSPCPPPIPDRVPMTVERRLDPEAARQLQPLWDYLAISARPISGDAIFVFGSRDFAVPDRAAELYHAGHAPRVLVTGSYGRLTRDVFPKTGGARLQGSFGRGGGPAGRPS